MPALVLLPFRIVIAVVLIALLIGGLHLHAKIEVLEDQNRTLERQLRTALALDDENAAEEAGGVETFGSAFNGLLAPELVSMFEVADWLHERLEGITTARSWTREVVDAGDIADIRIYCPTGHLVIPEPLSVRGPDGQVGGGATLLADLQIVDAEQQGRMVAIYLPEGGTVEASVVCIGVKGELE